jgi:hypothetical protein
MLHIVIVDNRGLTFVGDFDPNEPTIIRDARCVIRWGTTRHLSELAKDGPRANTRLGETSDVYLGGQGYIIAIPCEEKAWQ